MAGSGKIKAESTLKALKISGVATGCGIVLIAVAACCHHQLLDWAHHITRDVGISLLLAGIVGFFFELAMKSDFLALIMERAGVATNISDSGLVGIFKQRKDVEFEDKISRSQHVTIVFAYSDAWRGEFLDEIEELLQRGRQVTLLLPDPTNSVVLKELAIRFGKRADQSQSFHPEDEDKVQSNINAARGDFISKWEDANNGLLKVLYMDRSPMYSAFLFDESLVFVPYKHKAGSSKAPYFVFSKGWIYDFYAEDLLKLESQSTLTFHGNGGMVIHPPPELSP